MCGVPAVAHRARRRRAHRAAWGTATAVGAASALLLTAYGATPVDALRYAAAAALLDAALAVPAVRRFPVVLALLAPPIHLVALAAPMLRGVPLADRALWHLGFGLVAGLLAWGVVRLAGGDGPRTSPTRSPCPG